MEWGAWNKGGLRARFRMRSRIANAFLQVVPWINFVVVLALFLALSGRLTLKPGVVFELPRTAFQEGLQRGLTLVMLRSQRPLGEETLVFFDDVRYQLDVPEQGVQLRDELARAALRPDGRQLLLLADRRVPHGDVMTLVTLARSAGIQRVNAAIKPE
jgi:biopolymer transport protein ExbD